MEKWVVGMWVSATAPTAGHALSYAPKPSPLFSQDDPKDRGTSTVVLLDTEAADFVFVDVPERPVPSLLRGFSAPVKMEVVDQTDDDLVFLMANDPDEFNRWEAGQRLARGLLLRLYDAAVAAGGCADLEATLADAGGVPDGVVEAVRKVLTDGALDGAFKAAAVTLPAPSELVDAIPLADPCVLHAVRKYVVSQLAARLRPELEAVVKANDVAPGEPYSPDFASAAKRALKNKALAYLAALGDPKVTADLLRRSREATNMTDRTAAVAALVDADTPERAVALAEFYEAFKDEPLVLLKWLALQAGSDVPSNLDAVRALADHPAFSVTNPNCCYSVFLAFQRSPVNFHAPDGSGYAYVADAVLTVDKVNKQVAARIAGAFTSWKQFDTARQGLMQAQLRRIMEEPGLSENVYEIVSKSLDDK